MGGISGISGAGGISYTPPDETSPFAKVAKELQELAELSKDPSKKDEYNSRLNNLLRPGGLMDQLEKAYPEKKDVLERSLEMVQEIKSKNDEIADLKDKISHASRADRDKLEAKLKEKESDQSTRLERLTDYLKHLY